MSDTHGFTWLEVLEYLLRLILKTNVKVTAYNRDHHTEGTVVDGWLEIKFSSKEDFHQHGVLKDILDTITNSYIENNANNCLWGQTNLERYSCSAIICGVDHEYVRHEPKYKQYHKCWEADEDFKTYRLKYSLAVIPQIEKLIIEKVKQEKESGGVWVRLWNEAGDNCFRSEVMRKDLQVLKIGEESINTFMKKYHYPEFRIPSSDVYEFDLKEDGQDIFIAAYFVRNWSHLSFNPDIIKYILKL